MILLRSDHHLYIVCEPSNKLYFEKSLYIILSIYYSNMTWLFFPILSQQTQASLQYNTVVYRGHLFSKYNMLGWQPILYCPVISLVSSTNQINHPTTAAQWWIWWVDITGGITRQYNTACHFYFFN